MALTGLATGALCASGRQTFRAGPPVLRHSIGSPAVPDAAWQIRGKIARLRLPPLGGWIDVGHLAAGIMGLSMADQPATLSEPLPSPEVAPGPVEAGPSGPSICVLGLELPTTAGSPPEPVEWYARQCELVAWFSARRYWPVEVQAIWRAVPGSQQEAFAAAVELVIGVRTQQLEADPGLSVVGTLPCREVLGMEPPSGRKGLGPWGWGHAGPTTGAYLFRLGNGWSYVEMVHPTTRLASQWWPAEGGSTRLRHRLFGEPAEKLEKGVLLRAWIRGALLPQEDDLHRAARTYEAFLSGEPPLGA